MDHTVSMGQALTEMLSFFLSLVIEFLSSSPGIYLWGLMLTFFIVGIFAKLLTLPYIGIKSDRFKKLLRLERR